MALEGAGDTGARDEHAGRRQKSGVTEERPRFNGAVKK